MTLEVSVVRGDDSLTARQERSPRSSSHEELGQELAAFFRLYGLFQFRSVPFVQSLGQFRCSFAHGPGFLFFFSVLRIASAGLEHLSERRYIQLHGNQIRIIVDNALHQFGGVFHHLYSQAGSDLCGKPFGQFILQSGRFFPVFVISVRSAQGHGNQLAAFQNLGQVIAAGNLLIAGKVLSYDTFSSSFAPFLRRRSCLWRAVRVSGPVPRPGVGYFCSFLLLCAIKVFSSSMACMLFPPWGDNQVGISFGRFDKFQMHRV